MLDFCEVRVDLAFAIGDFDDLLAGRRRRCRAELVITVVDELDRLYLRVGWRRRRGCITRIAIFVFEARRELFEFERRSLRCAVGRAVGRADGRAVVTSRWRRRRVVGRAGGRGRAVVTLRRRRRDAADGARRVGDAAALPPACAGPPRALLGGASPISVAIYGNAPRFQGESGIGICRGVCACARQTPSARRPELGEQGPSFPRIQICQFRSFPQVARHRIGDWRREHASSRAAA